MTKILMKHKQDSMRRMCGGWSKTPAHSQQTIKTAPYKKSGKFSLNKNKCTEFVPKLKWEVTFELGCEVNLLCKCCKDIKGFPK